MSAKIYVNIHGGCYQGAENVPEGYTIEVVDWDNLLADEGTAEEWNRFDSKAQQFIRDKYPNEYRLIQNRSRGNQKDVI